VQARARVRKFENIGERGEGKRKRKRRRKRGKEENGE